MNKPTKPFTNLLAKTVEAANAARMNGRDRRTVDRIAPEVARRLQEGDYKDLVPIRDEAYNEPLGI